MVASGGHTEIYHVPEPGVFHRIGSTRDDAAGEAFDKIGKLMGLEYPAGPHMDRLAREGRDDQVPLPRARLKGDTLDLSMSGLKTAAKLFLEKEPRPIPEPRLRDIAASVEKAIVDVLVERLGTEKLQECGKCHRRAPLCAGWGRVRRWGLRRLLKGPQR